MSINNFLEKVRLALRDWLEYKYKYQIAPTKEEQELYMIINEIMISHDYVLIETSAEILKTKAQTQLLRNIFSKSDILHLTQNIDFLRYAIKSLRKIMY